MTTHSVDAFSIIGKHRLICLTQIASPDFAGGKPTKCWVDPAIIKFIAAAAGSFTRRDDGTKRHEDVDCTILYLEGGAYLHVVESGEEVALKRDSALGHEWKLKTV